MNNNSCDNWKLTILIERTEANLTLKKQDLIQLKHENRLTQWWNIYDQPRVLSLPGTEVMETFLPPTPLCSGSVSMTTLWYFWSKTAVHAGWCTLILHQLQLKFWSLQDIFFLPFSKKRENVLQLSQNSFVLHLCSQVRRSISQFPTFVDGKWALVFFFVCF